MFLKPFGNLSYGSEIYLDLCATYPNMLKTFVHPLSTYPNLFGTHLTYLGICRA